MVSWQQEDQSNSRESLCPRQLQQSFTQLPIVLPCDYKCIPSQPAPFIPLFSSVRWPHQTKSSSQKSQDCLERKFQTVSTKSYLQKMFQWSFLHSQWHEIHSTHLFPANINSHLDFVSWSPLNAWRGVNRWVGAAVISLNKQTQESTCNSNTRPTCKTKPIHVPKPPFACIWMKPTEAKMCYIRQNKMNWVNLLFSFFLFFRKSMTMSPLCGWLSGVDNTTE